MAMAVGRSVVGPECFLPPLQLRPNPPHICVVALGRRRRRLNKSIGAALLGSFGQTTGAIRSASLASRPKSSINLLLAGEFGRGCRKLGQLNSPNECSRTTSGLEAMGKARQQAVAYSSQSVSHSSQFSSNRGFSGERGRGDTSICLRQAFRLRGERERGSNDATSLANFEGY